MPIQIEHDASSLGRRAEYAAVITDAERDRAARLLRERYANGALTLSELDAQLDVVFTARSSAELHAALGDRIVDQLPARMVGADTGASDLERLERHLAPAEEIYWIGHPDTRIRLGPPDVVWIPMGIVWALISGLGVVAVPWPFKLPVIGFFVASLQMLFGRFVFANRRRRRTIYGVTERRVVSVLRRPWRTDAVESMYLTAIPHVTTNIRRSGTGTVIFGDAPRDEQFTWLTRSDDTSNGLAFYNVGDAQTIAELVETARERYALDIGAGGSAGSSGKTKDGSPR